MSLARRSFLKTGAKVALTAGVLLKFSGAAFGRDDSGGTATEFQVPYEAKTDRVYYFNRATFEPHLNTDFYVLSKGRKVGLQLVAVEDRRTLSQRRMARPGAECFALSFRAPELLTEITTIHTLEHAALGSFSLFMTGTEQERAGVSYEAVINHINL